MLLCLAEPSQNAVAATVLTDRRRLSDLRAGRVETAIGHFNAVLKDARITEHTQGQLVCRNCPVLHLCSIGSVMRCHAEPDTD